MRQLSGIDVSFLNMETPTVFGHVSSLNIYDPSTAPGGAGLEVTKQIILERMDQLAPFRRRLVEVPLGLDLPYWIEDSDFDIDFHVRHHAVAPPGTPEQLAETVARIVARPLDRSRPLWELYVIEGLEGGRIAQLTKIHHATIDGASGALMLSVLLDTDPNVRPSGHVATWDSEPVPTDAELLQITMGEYLRRPEKMLRTNLRMVRELAASTGNGGLRALTDLVAQPLPGRLGDLMRERLRGGYGTEVDNPPSLPPTLAPRTPFNRPITGHRRFAYTTIPLEDARAIRREHGCTFNDVVMALCSGTLRRYLIKHDALPDEPLIAMVPVSIRAGGESDTYQNRVSGLLSSLATNEADPVRRLRLVQQSMTAAKGTFAAIPAETLQDYTQFAPPAVAARAMRMYSRLRIADRMNPPFNVTISNVPGPAEPLYSAGARLEHFYPVSTIIDGQGLNMTVQSYNGNLDFGFISCRELVPDLWSLIDMLHESLEELQDTLPTTSTARKAPARKATTARKAAAARKTTARKATTAARKTTARKATTAARETTARKATKATKKAPARKAMTARKTTARKATTARRAPARKASTAEKAATRPAKKKAAAG
jgi:WS/DGAT/MGAT family acyltransferase